MDLAIVTHAVQSVLTLVVIGLVGYTLAYKGWFSPETKIMLPRLVTLVALPPCMVYNITTTLSHDALLHLAYGSLLPFASILATLVISTGIGKLIKVPPRRRAIFATGSAFSNTIFIGLPVNLALFGEAALPYVLLYYFANCSFFWTVGNYMMASDGDVEHAPLLSKATLKMILSPPMWGFIIGVSLVLFDIPLPTFLSNATMYLGNLTTPLIIIVLGISLQGMRLSSIKVSRDLVFLMFGRFVICPLTMIGLTMLFPLPDLMRQVFIVQSSLPLVMSIALLSSYYKSDPEFGAVAVSTSTLLSIVTIPIYMIIV